MVTFVPFLISAAFSLTYYFFSLSVHKFKRYDQFFVSFSAGFFLSYLFLTVFPQAWGASTALGEQAFILLLAGFVGFHLVEKFIMQHSSSRKEKEKELVTVRSTGFFVIHFLFGLVIVFLFNTENMLAFALSIIPIFFYMLSSAMISEHIHHEIRETRKGRWFASGSFFYGTVAAILLDIPHTLYLSIFSLITGIMLYILIRDILPRTEKGHPFYLIIGILLYLLLLELPLLLA